MFKISRLLCWRNITFTPLKTTITVQKRKIENEKTTKSVNLSTTPSGSPGVDKNKSRVKQIQKYWIFRFIDYVKKYEKVLDKNFPKTMHVYRVFSVGTKEFYGDLKSYI